MRTATASPDAWTPYRSKAPGKIAVFCFPFAGGSAAAFGPMWRDAPADLDIVPVELPGRWARASECVLESIEELAAAAFAALEPRLHASFALLGYSFGALITLELARRCAARGIEPRHMFVAACPAPQLIRPGTIHTESDDRQLIRAVERQYSGPEEARLDLRDPALVAMVARPLRADLKALETYHYKPLAQPLRCPVSVFGGTGDVAVSAQALRAWDAQAAHPIAPRLFEGGHFFLRTQAKALLAEIAAGLDHRRPIANV